MYDAPDTVFPQTVAGDRLPKAHDTPLEMGAGLLTLFDTVTGLVDCVRGVPIKSIILRSDQEPWLSPPAGKLRASQFDAKLFGLKVTHEQLAELARYLVGADSATPIEAILGGGSLDRPLPLDIANTRFRANVSLYNGGQYIEAVLRTVPSAPPLLEKKGLPPICLDFVRRGRGGLLIICGETGSGKSHTLSAYVDYANRHDAGHIVGVESPIELLHVDLKSAVMQREVGLDVRDARTAIHDALRQEPSLFYLGELRDEASARELFAMAESGLHVMTTMHSVSCVGAIQKLVNWAGGDKELRAHTLSESLIGVIYQKLVPTADKLGVITLYEVLPVRGFDSIKTSIASMDWASLNQSLTDEPRARSLEESIRAAGDLIEKSSL
jgi:Tfp pilus assembly pilus retraction ATPase PilT